MYQRPIHTRVLHRAGSFLLALALFVSNLPAAFLFHQSECTSSCCRNRKPCCHKRESRTAAGLEAARPCPVECGRPSVRSTHLPATPTSIHNDIYLAVAAAKPLFFDFIPPTAPLHWALFQRPPPPSLSEFIY